LFSDPVVLELASGFGEAIAYFANCHPDVMFVPTDPQQPCLERLRELVKLHENLMDPMELNIFRPSQWEMIAKNGGPYNGILCFNLIHLIPWNGTFTLLKYASQLLEEERGFFALHGPFLREGTFMSQSDREFDEEIKSGMKSGVCEIWKQWSGLLENIILGRRKSGKCVLEIGC
jgi:hypothetical protein